MSKTFKMSILLIVITLGILFLGGTTVNAETMSDEFKSYLNEEGKFEMNSAVPTDEEYFAFMVDTVTYDEDQWLGLMLTNVASDYSEVDLTINAYEENEEKHRVQLQWNYDETANQKIKNFVNTTLKDKTTFNVKDLELVNYWYNHIKNDYSAELVMYSGELKSILNYGNIEFDVSTRGGGNPPFKTEAIGFAYFGYDGSIYHVINGYGATANHILYVPTETENTPEAIGEAAQKRIDDYLGENDLEVCYVSTAWEYWVSYFYEEMKDVWMQDNPSLTLEQFEQMGNVYLPPYPSFEEGFETEFDAAGVSEDDLIYELVIPIDENMGDCKYVIIRRDSSKMVNPVSRTSDLTTNIEISTEETLPLDTIIQAKELTSGSEYDRIIEILKLTDSLSFDLKLYSASIINKYITQLDNGEFEVKIPVPENLKGKDLSVYYVGASDIPDVKEVDLESEPGYAIFKTTHFSIYTLGYKNNTPSPIKVVFDANGGKFGNETIYTIDDWKAELYDSLTEPTRDGYTFKGYYTEKTGGTKFEMILNESGIDEDMTFYAQWEENSSAGDPPIPEDGEQDGDDKETGSNSQTGDNNNTENTDKNNNTVNSDNPQTGDNIMLFVTTLGIAVIGIIATAIIKNKKR